VDPFERANLWEELARITADLRALQALMPAGGGTAAAEGETPPQPGTPAVHVQKEGDGAVGTSSDFVPADTIIELRRRVGAGPGTAVPHPSGLEQTEEEDRLGVIWETEYTEMAAIQDNVGSQGSRRAILCSDHHHALNPGVGLRWNGTDLEVYFANGEDLTCETAFGTDLFSGGTPGGNAYLGERIYQYVDDDYARHFMYRFNGTIGAKTKVLNGDNLGWIAFGGYHGGGGFAGSAWVGAVAKGDWDSAGVIPAELQFYTASDSGGTQKVAAFNKDGILELLLGGQLATDKQLQFRDSGIFAYSPADGVLGFSADGGHYRLYEPSSGGNYINVVVPGLSGNCSYTLPSALPASDKFLQSTSGGVMTWETPAAGGGLFFTPVNATSHALTVDGEWHDLDFGNEDIKAVILQVIGSGASVYWRKDMGTSSGGSGALDSYGGIVVPCVDGVAEYKVDATSGTYTAYLHGDWSYL